MSKKTVNAKNLAALGADRLASLLVELCDGDREIKRRVRMELVHAAGAGDLAHEVRKRLTTIGRSTSHVDWTRHKAFVADLATQLEMITGKIAPEAPAEAFELLWRFVELAPSVHERADDSRGDLEDLFDRAVAALGDVATRAGPDGPALADRVFDAISANDYGEWDGLLGQTCGAMGTAGLDRLKARIDAYESEPLPDEPSLAARTMHLGGGRVGISLDRSWPRRRKAMQIRDWRQQIADHLGDVDGFLAQYSADDLLQPGFAAEAAVRLLEDGRAEEALEIAVRAQASIREGYLSPDLDAAQDAALTALGRATELQAFRWARFTQTLSPDYLRALLKALPDFDDVEKEDEAKDLAFADGRFAAALAFFVNWPDLDRAAQLVLERADELDGDDYALLSPAADALDAGHPLAAVLCRRAMILFTLDNARTSRYRHAVRHVMACKSADAVIDSYGELPDHAAFMADLKDRHGRKHGFWRGLTHED